MKRFVIKIGNITQCIADGVVCPVTEQLKSSGAVSEEIFHNAASKLQEDLEKKGEFSVSSVVVTENYGLSVKKILLTVSPKWLGGNENEEEKLANCYKNCLEKAVELGLKTIVFPSISTGNYHFPVNLAAKVAVKTILDFLQNNTSLQEVVLVCLDQRTTLVYDMCLAQYCK